MIRGKMTAEYFYDSVGRRRKLSDNSMKAIQKEFRAGQKVAHLALTYGVSKALIRTITYNTPRQADLDRQAEFNRKWNAMAMELSGVTEAHIN